MKKTNINLMKIVAATSVCIFALFSVFAGSTAWFLSNQNYDGSSDSMAVDEVTRKLQKISLHRFVTSTTTDGITTYYFDQAEASSATIGQIKNGTASLRFVMDKYTLLRQTNPTFALIRLSDDFTASANDEISLTLTTETTTFLTSYTAQEVEEMTSRPLSNVIKATAGYFTAEVDGDGTTRLSEVSHTGEMTYAIDGTTKSASQYFLTAPNSYSPFVPFEGESPSTPITTLDLFGANSGEIVKYIYIIFDYNVPALESIYNHFLGQPFLEEDLHFQCDWTLSV